jgi:hypothetical protein
MQVFPVMFAYSDKGEILKRKFPQVLGVDVSELLAEAKLFNTPLFLDYALMMRS